MGFFVANLNTMTMLGKNQFEGYSRDVEIQGMWRFKNKWYYYIDLLTFSIFAARSLLKNFHKTPKHADPATYPTPALTTPQMPQNIKGSKPLENKEDSFSIRYPVNFHSEKLCYNSVIMGRVAFYNVCPEFYRFSRLPCAIQ